MALFRQRLATTEVVFNEVNFSVSDATLPFDEDFLDAALFEDYALQFPATTTEGFGFSSFVQRGVHCDVLYAYHE